MPSAAIVKLPYKPGKAPPPTVPAIAKLFVIAVTGPIGAMLAPSAPIWSLVNTLPAAGMPVFSVALAVSAFAIGASSIIAIPKFLGGVTLFAESLKEIAKFSVTVPLVLSGVFSVYR